MYIFAIENLPKGILMLNDVILDINNMTNNDDYGVI